MSIQIFKSVETRIGDSAVRKPDGYYCKKCHNYTSTIRSICEEIYQECDDYGNKIEDSDYQCNGIVIYKPAHTVDESISIDERFSDWYNTYNELNT